MTWGRAIRIGSKIFLGTYPADLPSAMVQNCVFVMWGGLWCVCEHVLLMVVVLTAVVLTVVPFPLNVNQIPFVLKFFSLAASEKCNWLLACCHR